MRLTALLALLLAALSLGLAACGDDDDDDGGSDQPQAFEIEVTDDGVTAPESADAGALELRFTNAGKRDHSAQVVAIGDGHSADEVIAAGEEWGDKGGQLARVDRVRRRHRDNEGRRHGDRGRRAPCG